MSAQAPPRLHKRIMQEAQYFTSNLPDGMYGGPVDDDISKWSVGFQGPSNSPYAKGFFALDIVFPGDYPFKPPQIKFSQKVYHPNIDDDGNICLTLLKTDSWKPSLRVLEVLKEIQLLMEQPNPDDPLNNIAASQYRENRQEFEKTAREWTSKYALKK
ncbi:hypothetical protein MIR68_001602 [Amoeboaphelidium protococcarum]|nr:hypothetical protein MIR68_001602 [Amoeboaphelidium protococcarum]